MKTTKHILIGVSNPQAQGREFIAAWERAASGLPVEEPVDRLYFESLTALQRALSPKRMELLQAAKSQGPVSIRKLAHNLKRDYKNVYTDVSELAHLGLIASKSQFLGT